MSAGHLMAARLLWAVVSTPTGLQTGLLHMLMAATRI
jgi:hypothetical protein